MAISSASMHNDGMNSLPFNAVLLLIDLQQAVDNPSWGPRNHPDAERVAGALPSVACRRPARHPYPP
jgi:hypothetical protein